MLGSGSGGNCTFIGDERSGLLIDAGLSAQETDHRLRQVGVDPGTLRGVLITHEHRDHVFGAESLAADLNLPIYANEKTTRAARGLSRVSGLHPFQTGRPFEVDGFRVQPIPLSHDAADPVAFCVEREGEKIGCLTDLGTPTDPLVDALLGCQILILEFNHDGQMLRNGPYPAHLKQRVASAHGHLSNQEAMGLLRAVAHPGLRHLFLAHISQVNNLPDLALLAAQEALHDCDAEPVVHLTWQDFPSSVATI